MAVADFGNRQPALGQRRLRHALAPAAEQELVWADAEGDGRAIIVPAAGATLEIEAAAVGDEPGFDVGIGRAERDRVIAEVGVHVTRRRQERREELIAGAVGLAHGCQTPEVLVRLAAASKVGTA